MELVAKNWEPVFQHHFLKPTFQVGSEPPQSQPKKTVQKDNMSDGIESIQEKQGCTIR